MTDQTPTAPPGARHSGITLVYDGDCPVCSAYSRMSRIRDDLGGMQLVDARRQGDVLEEITAAGLDMDEGMVLKLDGKLYFGPDAVHMLALLSTPHGWLNRLNRLLFGRPAVAEVVYPIARFLRNLLLRVLGRSKINNLGSTGRD